MANISFRETKELTLEILALCHISIAANGSAAPVESLQRTYTTIILCEIQRLECWLKEKDINDVENHIDILECIIQLFEDLIKPEVIRNYSNERYVFINDSKFVKIPALLNQRKSEQLYMESPADLLELKLFNSDSEGLRNFNTKLAVYINRLRSCPDSVNSWWNPGRKRKPVYAIREHAMTLYKVLSDNKLGCINGTQKHEAKLCLSLYDKLNHNEGVSFDLFFSTHENEWLESQTKVKAEINPLATGFRLENTAKQVDDRIPAGILCNYITPWSARRRCLHMVIDHNELHIMHLKHTEKRLDKPIRMIPMTYLFEKFQHEKQSNERSMLEMRERRAIGVLLSHILLHFAGSSWLSEKWDHRSISFLRHRNHFRMALSSKSQHSLQHESNTNKRMRSYPAILSLGILLLEMELKKVSKPLYEQQDQNWDEPKNEKDDPEIPDADLLAACELFDELQRNWPADPIDSDFVKAVRACLRLWEIEMTKGHAGIHNDDDIYGNVALRRKIHQEIVTPLENDFCKSFNINPDELNNELPLISPFGDHDDFLLHLPSNNKQADLPSAAPYEIHQECTGVEMNKIPMDSPSKNEDLPIFFDESSAESSPQIQTKSKEWLAKYEIARHRLMKDIDPEDHPAFDSSRVKVAILDTGFDPKHPSILGALQNGRIKDWKNWASDDLEMRDTCGHGTHITALLLKIAPETDIYVGRVASESGSPVTPGRIANAIQHAAEIWKVDIITMSFGLRKYDKTIHSAIRNAFGLDILMFAATSNDGNNQDVAFPAREHDMVIGINSTDAFGSKSAFSPSPLERSDNLAILGEAIESSWPKALGGLTKCKSGASYATPIAAGIASVMLLYARLKMTNEVVKELETCKGMKRLLASMSMKTNDGYHYLRPWMLWGMREDQIRAHLITYTSQ